MQVWKLEEAKEKLTELLNESKQAPQIIACDGVEEVVVMSMEKYRKFTEKNQNIVSFFQNSPLYAIELDLKRDTNITDDSSEIE